MTSRLRSLAAGLLAALLLAAVGFGTGACAATDATTSLTVLGPWTGDEQTAFEEVLRRFTAETDINVIYTGTRALSQVLRSDVQEGQPPDIAVLPSPGELASYVRSEDVQPVDEIFGELPEGSYSEQWLQLLRLGTDKLYAVTVKADLKSLIWYDRTELSVPPRSWEELMILTDGIRARGQAPWCIGMNAPPGSGFPGTDWIEDILLHQSGPDVYQRWAAGTVAWTSPEVKQAWSTWAQVVATPGSVQGGASAALLTDFGDARRPMFDPAPGCSLEHQASFAMAGFRSITRDGANLSPGEDFDFFEFPTFGTTPGGTTLSEVSADLAAMFRPSEQARQLMSYLAGQRGQGVWPSLGTAFSANKQVLAQGVYTDPVSIRIAQTLTTAETLCFDASDLMPARMSSAFYRAVLAHVADPTQLDAVLSDLELVRDDIRPAERLDVPCGR